MRCLCDLFGVRYQWKGMIGEADNEWSKGVRVALLCSTLSYEIYRNKQCSFCCLKD